MKLSHMYRAALIATMLILSPGLGTTGFAQTNSPQGVKNLVLVHGTWAHGSCWSQSDCAPPSEGFSCGRCAESFDLVG
jgi:hypothetical protein